MEKTEIIWNSKFSIDLIMDNNVSLDILHNNIFMFQPPAIQPQSSKDDEEVTYAKMMIRFDTKGLVENELYEKLSGATFTIKTYYPDKDSLNWTYTNCSVSKIIYDEFYNKSKNDRPFNVTLLIRVPNAIYHGNNKEFYFCDGDTSTDDVDTLANEILDAIEEKEPSFEMLKNVED